MCDVLNFTDVVSSLAEIDMIAVAVVDILDHLLHYPEHRSLLLLHRYMVCSHMSTI